MTRARDAQDAKTRMVALTAHLLGGATITTRYIRERFMVSKATAKRDFAVLEQMLPVETSLVMGEPTGRGRIPAYLAIKLMRAAA